MNNNNYLFAFLFLVFLAGSVSGVNRGNGYDYSGENNNITALNNGAFYNRTFLEINGRMAVTGDGLNDYVTITPNSTSPFCLFTPTTPWTVFIEYYAPVRPNGGVFFKWCYDDTGNGSGYQFRTGGSGVGNFIVNNGSTVIQTSNATMFSTLNEWTTIQYVYDGQGNLTVYHNGSSVYSSTMQGKFANRTITDNTTLLAQNGGALRLNASIRTVQVNFVVFSAAELAKQRNGTSSGLSEPNRTNLTLYLTFQNTTSTNLTIGTTLIRATPSNFLGFQAVRSPYVFRSWCGVSDNYYCSQSEYQTYMNLTTYGAGYGLTRGVFDLSNTLATFNGVNFTFNRNLGSGQTSKNVNFQTNQVLMAYQAGRYVVFNTDDMPVLTADNTSGCNYGVSGTDQETCRPITNGSYVQGALLVARAIAQSLIEYGCFNYTTGVCAYEGFNEFYLSNYFQGNVSAVPQGTGCFLRNHQVNTLYNQGVNPTAIKAALTAFGYNSAWIRYYAAPSSYNDNDCSEEIHANWSSQHPYGSVNGTDYDTFHTYVYSCSNVMASYETDSNENEVMAALGGYTDRYIRTEGNIDCNALDEENTTQYQSFLMSSILYPLNSTSLQAWAMYRDASTTTTAAESDSTILFRGSNETVHGLQTGSVTVNNVTLTGAYYALKNYMTVPSGTTLYPCTSTDNNVRCLAFRYNTTSHYLIVDNRNANQLDIDAITLTGFNVTSAKRLTQGMAMRINTSETVTSGVTDPVNLYPYGVTVYEFTVDNANITNISATYTPTTYIVNISEPSSQTFTVSITNPSNQTYNIVWQNTTGGASILHCYNLTSCTQIGNYTSAGQYNWTVTTTGETNTLTKVWLLQINNTIDPGVNIGFNITARNNITGAYLTTFNATISYYDLSNISILTSIANNPLLQETANVSVGGGTLATGNYTFMPFYFYINYSKPTGVLLVNATWQSRLGASISTTNSTISSGCLNAYTNIIQTRIYSNSSQQNSSMSCYNGTGFEEVKTFYPGGSAGTISNTTNLYDGNYSTSNHYNGDWVATIGSSGGASVWEEGMWWGTNNTTGEPYYSSVSGLTNSSNLTMFINTTFVNVTVYSAGFDSASYSNYPVTSNLTASLSPLSLNLTFYDEVSLALLNGTLVSFFLQGQNTGTTYNNTTLTGSNVINAIVNDIYTITYSAPGYSTRNYVYNVNSSASFLQLYLLSTGNSTVALFTVVDVLYRNAVPSAIIYLQSKNTTGTNYNTVEICTTDSNGECVVNVRLVSVTEHPVYRVLIYYLGNLVYNSGDTAFTTNTRTFAINIASAGLQDFFDIAGSYHVLNENHSTVNVDFNYTFADTFSVITQECLYITSRDYSVVTNLYSFCDSNNTGTIYTSVALVGLEICASGYAITADGVQHGTERLCIVNEQDSRDLGARGLFFIVLPLFITFIMIFRSRPGLAIMAAGLVLFVTYYTNLLGTTSLVIGGVLILLGAIYMSNKT